MKLRRRHRIATSDNDRDCLIENNFTPESSKVRRLVWKFAKGTWKALKTGFQTTMNSQHFSMTLEPTAVATTIIEYQARKRRVHGQQ